jgi:hypothetical protein
MAGAAGADDPVQPAMRTTRGGGMKGTLGTLLVMGLALLAPSSAITAQNIRTTPQAGTSKPLVPGLFSNICNSGEVLVGVYGRADRLIDRIGGYCVRVTASGAWSGEVRATDSYGGGGGNTFDRKCARGEAISAFRGRHGMYVDRIEIRCRTLASPTSVNGTGTYKSPVGGTGGSTFGPYTCPNAKPAAGFGGQTSAFVDALFFICRP